MLRLRLGLVAEARRSCAALIGGLGTTRRVLGLLLLRRGTRAVAAGLVTRGAGLGLAVLRLVRRLRSGRVEATLMMAATRPMMTWLIALLRAARPL